MTRYILIGSLVLFSCRSVKKTLTVNPETVLHYNYSVGELSSVLQIHLKSDNPIRVFEYQFDYDTIKHEVAITPEAGASSTELYPFFGLFPSRLNNKVALWLSDTLYQSAIRNDTVTIYQRKGYVKRPVVYKVVENQQLKISIEGKSRWLDVRCLRSKDNDQREIWFVDDVANPLIVKLDIGLIRLELQEVVRQKKK